MLQKARRGKEINRGVVDQPFSHLYFSLSENEKGQRLHGRRRAIVHATVLVTNNELCQNLRASGLELGIS